MTGDEKDWIEMRLLRNLRYATKEWIPVYGFEYKDKHDKYPNIGFREDFFHVETGIVYNDYRENAGEMKWDDWYQDSVNPYISEDKTYNRAGVLYDRKNNKIGERLVMGQFIDSEYQDEIYINQDFILAYKLVRKNDIWIRPKDNDREVIRSRTCDHKDKKLIEIRSEFLRDYLSALNASFRLYYYRERHAIVDYRPNFINNETSVLSDNQHNRHTLSCHHINPNGDLPDSKGILVKLWRNDVDEEDTIPDFNKNSIEGQCHSYQNFIEKENADRYHLHSRLWRGEWIEGNEQSCLIGYSEPNDDFMVYADNSGQKVPLSSLKYEEINKYLWFKPEIVNLLISNQGGKVEWDTKETGFISTGPDTSIHFGLNKKGLVNVYAYDIARLPYWQKEIWVGQNTPPDDGVSIELAKIQITYTPIKSYAPEEVIVRILEQFNNLYNNKFSLPILNDHEEIHSLLTQINRFQVHSDDSLESLAKNLVKLSIERLNCKNLKKTIGSDVGKEGSLHLLGILLEKKLGVENGEKIMAPLRSLYQLRLRDSHLKSKKIKVEEHYVVLQINRQLPYVWQGAQLIESTAKAFNEICKSF